MRIDSRIGRVRLVLASVGLAGPVHADTNVVFRSGLESLQLCDPVATPSTCPGFRVQTPPLKVPAGEIQTYCYYVRGGNAATFGVRRWATTSGAGQRGRNGAETKWGQSESTIQSAIQPGPLAAEGRSAA